MRLVVLVVTLVSSAATMAWLSGALLAQEGARAPCGPGTGSGAAVGKVLSVRGEAHQGKARLSRKNQALHMGATLCTAGPRGSARSGELEFVVEALKRTTCRMAPASRVTLYPTKPKRPKPVILRFHEGKTYCGTGTDKTGKERLYEAAGGKVKLLIADPLFGVDASAKTTTVKVKLGAVTVQARTGGAVVVGPGQQSTVPAQGPAKPPVPLVETPEDKDAFADIKSAVPKPDYSRPSANGSPTLKRIYADDYIRVGFDSEVTDDDTYNFYDEFFTFLAKSWGVNFYAASDPPPDLVNSLKAHDLEVALTKDRPALASVDTMPLFTDPRGADWYVGVEPDKVFLEALRNFVRATVNGGQYSSLYRAAFGKEPSLDVLKAVLSG